jgi:septal ring factor EnvC (AmiA/AmiB activator)
MKQRQRRLAEISATTAELDERRQQLASTQARNQRLLEKDRSERDNLRELREQRSDVIEEIRTKRTSLTSELEATRREAEQLQERLRAIIAADASSATNLDPVETAELAAFAASFDERKGRLPWPASGVVTESFGTRIHPVYRTRTPNPGIEIATRPAANVQAVHDGVVNRILTMPGYGTMVTLSHGEYTTVYGNMSSVLVQQGQRVQTGDVIGQSGTSNEPRKTALFFALFTPDGQAIDPATWLREH